MFKFWCLYVTLKRVFVFKASADLSLVQCFQDLSKRLSLALKHEERRCGYLSHQAITMLTVCDEVASLPEGQLHVCHGRSVSPPHVG